MKFTITLLLSTLSFLSYCSESSDRISAIRLQSEMMDSSLSRNESIYTFQFSELYREKSGIVYSIDDSTITGELDAENRLIISSSPGQHFFQFYIDGYQEISTGSLAIKAQFNNIYTVEISISLRQNLMKKPVIYLYPVEEMDVSIELSIHGEDAFYYPSYENGWQVSAHPNGDLTIDDKTYSYLFWEANSEEYDLDYKEGFVVRKPEVVEFLEVRLTESGLTAKEQADFITFWGPQLAQNDQNFVHFIFNETCNEFADLTIIPRPDHIFRIYMIWQPIERTFQVKQQEMKVINREGFSVLEWGGMELSPQQKHSAL